MKRITFLIIIEIVTLVSCVQQLTIDETILPKGNSTDLGCDISILQSAFDIAGQ